MTSGKPGSLHQHFTFPELCAVTEFLSGEDVERILDRFVGFEDKKKLLDLFFELNGESGDRLDELAGNDFLLSHFACETTPCSEPGCPKDHKRKRLFGPGYSSDNSSDGPQPMVTRSRRNQIGINTVGIENLVLGKRKQKEFFSSDIGIRVVGKKRTKLVNVPNEGKNLEKPIVGNELVSLGTEEKGDSIVPAMEFDYLDVIPGMKRRYPILKDDLCGVRIMEVGNKLLMINETPTEFGKLYLKAINDYIAGVSVDLILSSFRSLMDREIVFDKILGLGYLCCDDPAKNPFVQASAFHYGKKDWDKETWEKEQRERIRQTPHHIWGVYLEARFDLLKGVNLETVLKRFECFQINRDYLVLCTAAELMFKAEFEDKHLIQQYAFEYKKQSAFLFCFALPHIPVETLLEAFKEDEKCQVLSFFIHGYEQSPQSYKASRVQRVAEFEEITQRFRQEGDKDSSEFECAEDYETPDDFVFGSKDVDSGDNSPDISIIGGNIPDEEYLKLVELVELDFKTPAGVMNDVAEDIMTNDGVELSDEAYLSLVEQLEAEFKTQGTPWLLFGPAYSSDNAGDGPIHDPTNRAMSTFRSLKRKESIVIIPGSSLGMQTHCVQPKRTRGTRIVPGGTLNEINETEEDLEATVRDDVMELQSSVVENLVLPQPVGNFDNEVTRTISITSTSEVVAPLGAIAVGNVAREPPAFGPCDRVCTFCGARYWAEELNSSNQYTLCCRRGRVVLPNFSEPSALFKELFGGATAKSKLFFKRIRVYNTNLSFASIEMHEESFGSNGVPSLSIMGSVYHKVGGLEVLPNDRPKFLQTYFYDTTATDSHFYHSNERVLMNEIRAELRNVNSILNGLAEEYVPIIDQRERIPEGYLILKDTPFDPTKNAHCYQGVTSTEVSGLLLDQGGQQISTSRVVKIQLRDGALMKIPSDHSSYDPMAYVLFHSKGETGWTYEMNRHRQGITCRDYYRFRLHFRDDNLLQKDILLKGRQLSQQYVIDMYAKIEEHEMKFVRQNQQRLKAELYNNLHDAVMEGDEENAGKRFILPSSVIGSPRAMHAMYLDALAIVQNVRKPSLFITMTCNPEWPEILAELKPGEKPWMRYDLVCRVWEMRRKSFMEDVLEKHVFGRVIAHMYTIEFQKRGLPHMHLLLILDPDDDIKTTEDLDRLISAEIPDKDEDPELYEIICANQLHGPCGCLGPNRPCMQNDNHKCRFHFPQDFVQETHFKENAYPAYRRRSPEDGGNTYTKNDFTFDNRWVVSYPNIPWLMKKHKCHINGESCTSMKSVKYVFKYTTKGPDLTTVGIGTTGAVDEIKQFQEARYISPHFAFYRIFGFSMSERNPAVERLPVHLPGDQMIMYAEGEETAALARPETSKLISYFEVVANEIANPIENPFNNVRATDLTYPAFVKYYAWKTNLKKWSRRTRPRSSNSIGRIYNVSQSVGEKYFLRRLLHIVKGAYSYEYLRTVDGIVHPTFRAACAALGLLADDKEWHDSLREASMFASSYALRTLFVIIITQSQPSDPFRLWDVFKDDLSDDKLHARRLNVGNRDLQHEPCDYNECLHDLNDLITSIRGNGESVSTYHIPEPVLPRQIIASHVLEEVYDLDEQRLLQQSYEVKLNPEQRFVYDKVIDLCNQTPSEREFPCVFIDAPGGTGKTFTFKAILANRRAFGDVAIAVGTSAISAILLPGGRTAHSRLKIPIPCTEDSMCHLTRRSEAGKLLMKAKILIWDEIVMADRKSIECFDRSMRDLNNVDLPFGGLLVLFGGDFRQLLPVVPKGSRAQIINACVMRSYLWKSMLKLSLTRNERLLQNGDHGTFCKFLLDVGENKVPLSETPSANCISIPPPIVFKGDLHELIDWVHPDLYNVQDQSAILSAWNDEVDTINDECLKKMNSLTEYTLRSNDELANEPGQVMYPTEFLNSLTPSGFPLFNLRVKIGSPVMLLRNINPSKGLCNGTRIKITHVSNNLIKGIVLNGTNIGSEALLPRILFTTDDTSPFQFTRRQFPIKLAYAMTINKCQGQSMCRIGIYLPRPLFNHGGLYVALSRCTTPENVRVLVTSLPNVQGEFVNTVGIHTRNIVYSEVFK